MLSMVNDRKGDYIGTFTGKKFYPLDPRPEDVCLEDIAHSLSLINRFNGHTKSIYTVADHCINVEKYLILLGVNEKVRLHGLLHDASEAYICDIPSPLKRMIPEYKAIEKAVQAAIIKFFWLTELSYWEEKMIKTADEYMLAVEAKELMANTADWNLMRVPQVEISPAYWNAKRLYIKKVLYLMKKVL